MAMQQFVLSPAAGKRLIGKAIAQHPSVRTALRKATVVIVAGTTNGYVAEELLARVGQADGFDRRRFFRGITRPPSAPTAASRQMPDEKPFSGDVVLTAGQWQKGKTIFDVVDDLAEGDVILKGANALDVERRQAAVLIGHPKGGTIGAAIQAIVGRRVHVILPVGLEKRVPGNLSDLARRLNAPGSRGFRLLPVPGEVVTEIEAFELLTGAKVELVAAGGVCGAEGSVWLTASGTAEQEKSAGDLAASVSREPAFDM
jgi:hypothetical protein